MSESGGCHISIWKHRTHLLYTDTKLQSKFCFFRFYIVYVTVSAVSLWCNRGTPHLFQLFLQHRRRPSCLSFFWISLVLLFYVEHTSYFIVTGNGRCENSDFSFPLNPVQRLTNNMTSSVAGVYAGSCCRRTEAADISSCRDKSVLCHWDWENYPVQM